MSTAYATDLEFGGSENSTTALQAENQYPEPGVYHLAIQAYKGEETKFTLTIEVVSPGPQRGRKFYEDFFFPNRAHRDGGKMAATRLKVLAIALGLVEPAVLMGQDKQRAVIEWDERLEGQQFIAEIQTRTYRKHDGGEGLNTEIKGRRMWHVADPLVAAIPKDTELLDLYVGFPLSAEYLAWLTAERELVGQNVPVQPTSTPPRVRHCTTPMHRIETDDVPF